MKTLHMITFLLVIIGGINWLLVTLRLDIAMWGLPMSVVKAVYILVGLSAIYLAFTHKKDCKICGGSMNMPKM